MSHRLNAVPKGENRTREDTVHRLAAHRPESVSMSLLRYVNQETAYFTRTKNVARMARVQPIPNRKRVVCRTANAPT